MKGIVGYWIGKPVISVSKRNPANLIAVKKSRKHSSASYASHAGSGWMETRLIHEWFSAKGIGGLA